MLVASLGIGRTSEQNLNENNSMREAKEKKKKNNNEKEGNDTTAVAFDGDVLVVCACCSQVTCPNPVTCPSLQN